MKTPSAIFERVVAEALTIVCGRCKGKGTESWQVDRDPAKGREDWPCLRCDAKGTVTDTEGVARVLHALTTSDEVRAAFGAEAVRAAVYAWGDRFEVETHTAAGKVDLAVLASRAAADAVLDAIRPDPT